MVLYVFLSSSDRVVYEPELFHFLGVKHVAAVYDDWGAQKRTDLLPIRFFEFFPFSHDDECVGVFERGILVFGVFHLVS